MADKEEVFKEAAKRLSEIFGEKVTIKSGKKDFNGIPNFEIEVGDKDKAEKVIDKLIVIRNGANTPGKVEEFGKNSMGFNNDNGTIVFFPGQVLDIGAKTKLDEDVLKKLEKSAATYNANNKQKDGVSKEALESLNKIFKPLKFEELKDKKGYVGLKVGSKALAEDIQDRLITLKKDYGLEIIADGDRIVIKSDELNAAAKKSAPDKKSNLEKLEAEKGGRLRESIQEAQVDELKRKGLSYDSPKSLPENLGRMSPDAGGAVPARSTEVKI